MGRRFEHFFRRLPAGRICPLVAVALVVSAGCTSAPQAGTTLDSQLTYGYSSHQLPPQPVYNRLTWVRSPDPLPSRDLPMTNARLMMPVLELKLGSTTLERAARALASAGGYHVYVASSVAGAPVRLHQLGTLDELAHALAEKSGAEVRVDHADRSLVFTAVHAPAPELYGEGAEGIGSLSANEKVIYDEHQSVDARPSS